MSPKLLLSIVYFVFGPTEIKMTFFEKKLRSNVFLFCS